MEGFEPEFSRKLAARGWIGMTWPKRYGGGERSAFENFVVNEELLAAGAPVAAHWVGVRQTGPLFLRFGNDSIKDFFLPRLAMPKCFFPRTDARTPDRTGPGPHARSRVDGGWVSTDADWSSGGHARSISCAAARGSARTTDGPGSASSSWMCGPRASPSGDLHDARRAHFNETS